MKNLMNIKDNMSKYLNKVIARQGDVALRLIGEVPKDYTKQDISGNKRVVLAYGEVTGHAHAFYEPQKIELYKSNDPKSDSIILNILETVNLAHGNWGGKNPDHEAITLPAGITVEVIRQRQYNYWTDSEERIAD